MSISTEINRILTSKEDIIAAIEAKGVVVPEGATIDQLAALIYLIITGGGPPAQWNPHPDWIDISEVGDNEINLLVTEGTGLAFACSVSSGTYCIDWGDNTVTTGCTTNTIYQHQHTVGGTPCTLGYNTWKVRIYVTTSANIVQFGVRRHSYTLRDQYSPILWVVFGTTHINNFTNAFYINDGGYAYCKLLQSCTIPSLQYCTSCQNTFQYCSGLIALYLPSSWGAVLYCNSMLNGCSNLSSVVLPSSWGSVQQTSSMFYQCGSLVSIILPSSWGVVVQVGSMFYGCYSLHHLILPSVSGNITNASLFVNSCTSLKNVTGIEYLGSATTQSNFDGFIVNCEFMQQNIVIGSRLTKIGIYGAVDYPLKITSIRLTNAASTFTGSSPHVNVSYTSMAAADLNALFGDLPTLTSKTINITGCPGAATCTRSIATAKGWTVIG